MSVTVFSKHQCKYCAEARALLDTKANVKLTYVYLDDQEDYDAARAEMMRLMGLGPDAPRPTVPQIFFAQEHFPGGATALLQLEREGKLDAKLESTEVLERGIFPPPGFAWKLEEIDPNDF